MTPLSPTDKARATIWDLSDTEWRRYRSLMDGIRGSISPATLSPIEVLGIHARDEAERRRYAERWAPDARGCRTDPGLSARLRSGVATAVPRRNH